MLVELPLILQEEGSCQNPLTPTPRGHLEEGITPKPTCQKHMLSECPSQRHRA